MIMITYLSVCTNVLYWLHKQYADTVVSPAVASNSVQVYGHLIYLNDKLFKVFPLVNKPKFDQFARQDIWWSNMELVILIEPSGDQTWN